MSPFPTTAIRKNIVLKQPDWWGTDMYGKVLYLWQFDHHSFTVKDVKKKCGDVTIGVAIQLLETLFDADSRKDVM